MEINKIDSIQQRFHQMIKISKRNLSHYFSREKIGITPFQYGVLCATKESPITVKEIAKWLGFKSPSIVPAVDILEKMKLLTRQQDTKDRRKIQLKITEKGKKMINKIRYDSTKDILQVAFDKLPLAKQQALLQLLQDLMDNLPQ